MKDGGNCYLMEDDSNCNHMYSLELTVLSEEIHPGSSESYLVAWCCC